MEDEGSKMKTIDLSYDISDNMPVYSGDESVLLKRTKSLKKDSYNAYKMSMGLHSGTHVDIPHHLTADGRLISTLPLERFMGKGVIIDARRKSVVSYKPEFDALIKEKDIVLICTAFADMYKEPEKYFGHHPVIDDGLCGFLIEKKIKMLGIDMPSPDNPPFHIHKKLLEKDIYIIENMANLQTLLNAPAFEIFAVPLKIQAEASPVRAFAVLNCEDSF